MEPISRFTLATHSGPYERWPSNTALFDDGRDTGVTVPGYVLDGQYRCDDGFLLLLSQDCPFEESYTFLLLDDDYSIRAQQHLGVPYGSFLLHTHWPVSSTEIRLHFYTRLIYSLSIQHRARWWQRSVALRLTNNGAAPNDARAQASIGALEQQLAATEQRLQRERSPGV
jgi:hypothetical protein